MCSDSCRLLTEPNNMSVLKHQCWMNFGLWEMFRIILYKNKFNMLLNPCTDEGPLTSQRFIQMKVCSADWNLLLFGPSSIRGRCVEVSWSFLGLQMKLHNSWKVLFSGGVEKLIEAPSAWSYFKTCSIRAEWYKHSAASSVTHVFICTLSTLKSSAGNMWEKYVQGLFSRLQICEIKEVRSRLPACQSLQRIGRRSGWNTPTQLSERSEINWGSK